MVCVEPWDLATDRRTYQLWKVVVDGRKVCHFSDGRSAREYARWWRATGVQLGVGYCVGLGGSSYGVFPTENNAVAWATTHLKPGVSFKVRPVPRTASSWAANPVRPADATQIHAKLRLV